MPGVYLFLDRKGVVLYVGKANNLCDRVASYFGRRALLPKTARLVSQTVRIRTVAVESEIESLLLEASYIKKFHPYYNSRLTDGKAYPLIEVTIKDPLPKVLIARREVNKRAVYFGPFPSAKAVKMVLQTIRKIFPFQSVRNHQKRRCLYNHLGLCPCPPLFTRKEENKQYRRTIRYLTLFFSGKTRRVVRELERERNQESKTFRFEKARQIQETIDAIRYITTQFKRPFEYEVNPNLRDDLRRNELNELQRVLRRKKVSVGKLTRIEGYDVSNIQGKQAVGSLVVAKKGELDASQYRRFRIRAISTPNDVFMLKEVLTRRLTHSEWQLPDLILIDGGKPQLQSALSVLKAFRLSIPVIALAKKQELIVTKEKNIKLAAQNKALLLLRRIRDEAHRFALAYHTKLRRQATFD